MAQGIWETFQGVYPALITPLDRNNQVNERVLRALVDHHLASGLRGFFVCGSTGEGLVMRIEERKRVAEVVVEQNNRRGMSIIHVGHPSSDVAAELARHAEAIGADAVSSVPPIYYPVGFEGMLLHYRTIAKATHLPLIAYNIPGITGVSVREREMRELFKIENVIGMKFTDPDYYTMRNIIELVDGECIILSGLDQLFLPALTMGAGGSIGSTQNLMPRHFVSIYQAFLRGDLEGAAELQYQVNRVIQVLLSFGSVSAWKAVLSAQGFDCGPCRAPLKTLSEEKQKEIVCALDGMGVV